MNLDKKLPKESGIYSITSAIDGKIYIGSAKNFSVRREKHLMGLKHNKHHSSHLQYAWNKYGKENFTFNILEKCPIDRLIDREQHYLDLYIPFDHSVIYNHCPKAYSAVGRVYSPETRLKFKEISRSKKGVSFDIVDPQGKLHHARCITEFAEQHNLKKDNLYGVVAGYNKVSGGWHLPNQDLRPYRFLDEWGKLHIIPRGKLSEFRRTNKKNQVGLRCVLNKTLLHYTGWALPERTDLYCELVHSEHGNVIVSIKYTNSFVKHFGLNRKLVRKLINRTAHSHKGWRLLGSPLPSKYSLIGPDNASHIIIYGQLKAFCKKNQLNYEAILDVIAEKTASYMGWRRPPSTTC